MASDTFLKEQLARIQELIGRMRSLERRSAELPERLELDRAALRRDPLHEVRDFRTVSSRHWEAARAEVGDDSRRRRRDRRRHRRAEPRPCRREDAD